MTVVGELPAETTEAPKPKSRKKYIIGAGAAVAIVVGVVAVTAGLSGGGGGSILAPKPGPEAVVKSYLTALSDGKGADAVKFLDPQNKVQLDMAAASALSEAKGRIQDIKVGEEVGATPQESGDNATVRAKYTLAGKETSVDLALVKAADGWVIHDPATIHISAPEVLASPTGKVVANASGADYSEPAPVEYAVTVGKGLLLSPGKSADLFPAEYPLSYSGSKYFQLRVDSFNTHLTSDYIKVNDALVAEALQAPLTKYVNDCIASGQTATVLNDQPCGINSVSSPATLAKVQTDTSDWALTSAPALKLTPGGPGEWTAEFATTAHRVWINTLDPTVGANENVAPKFKCRGAWDFTDQGEPQFASGSCNTGKMYALTAGRATN